MTEHETPLEAAKAAQSVAPVRCGPGRPAMKMRVDPHREAVEESIISGDKAKSIGERIKEIRHSKVGGSQKTFAETLGVSRGLVSHWEVGKGINRHHLVQIGAVFDISLYWLLDGAGRPYMSKKNKVLERKVAERQMSADDEEKFWTELLAFAEFRLASYPRIDAKPAKPDGNGPEPAGAR